MKVIKFLKKIAAKTKLIQMVKEAETQPMEAASIATTVVSLSRLIIDKEEELNNHVNAPELNIPFDKVYELLKIVPPQNGWGVDKVIQVLSAESIKDLSSDKAKKFIKDILAQNNVVFQEIIKDAISRDKALDTFEQFAYSKFQERDKDRSNQIESLSQQIEDCKKNIQRLETLQAKDKDLFQQWIMKKIDKEDELVKVVGLLTSDSLISKGQVTSKNKR